MERRLRIDPFAFALGALALLTLIFFGARNGGAVVMSGLCLAGLIAARLAGFNNRALVPLGGGLVLLLYLVWINPPPLSSRETSALVHATGGLLAGWAVAEYLRGRARWPLWAVGALAGVVGLTVLWELGEWLGDRLLTTALIPNRLDSAIDITFGSLGGALGVLAAGLLPPRAAR